MTTVPIKLLLRLQINLKVPKFAPSGSSKFQHIFFPAIWFEVDGAMSPSSCQNLQLVLKLPQILSICTVVSMSLILMLVLLLATKDILRHVHFFTKIPTTSEEAEDLEMKE